MSSPHPPNRIAELREVQGWTLRQLAARLDPMGEGPTERTILRWERSESGVPDTWKVKLAELFGVSVVWLMHWEDQDNGNNGGNGERAAA